MNIYTSYFAKLNKIPSNIVPIAICGWPPKWYNGIVEKSVAPSWDILSEYKKNHDEVIYTRRYKDEILSKLSPKDFGNKLYLLANRHDVAMICFEKPTDFCHRFIVAEWLSTNLGIEVKELSL